MAEITKEQLLAELETMKAALIEKSDEKIQRVVEEKTTEITKSIEALKSMNEKDATKEALEKMKYELDIATKAIDKLSIAMQMNIGRSNNNPDEPIAVQKALKNAVLANKDKIVNLEKGDGKLTLSLTEKSAVTMTVANAVGGVVPITYNSRIVSMGAYNMHVRDIFSVVPSATDSYSFLRHTTEDGEPAYQTEGESKAKVSDSFTMVNISLNDLAGIEILSKRLLRNYPALQAFISNRLPYKYMVAEDAKAKVVLASATGAGTAPTTGSNIVRILNGIAIQRNAGYNVNMIIINDKSWAKIVTTASTDGIYTLPNVVVVTPNGQLTIAGIPVTTAAWVQEDQCYLGDNMAFEIVQSEALSLTFSEHDDKNFQQNLITARVEAAVGFALRQPKGIMRIDLGDFSS
jgi:HK97 family phage major capsid protein